MAATAHKRLKKALVREWHVVVVFLVALAMRTLMALAYAPGISPDTSGYLELGRLPHLNGVLRYSFFRTPTYPLLIRFTSSGDDSFRGTVLLQMAMGIAGALMLSDLAVCLSGRRVVGCIVGVWDAMSAHRLLLETLVLTEAATGFLVTAAVWLLVRITQRDDCGRRGDWELLGLVTAAVALCRPNNAFLFLVLPAAAAYQMRRRLPWRAIACRLAYFGVVAVTPFLLWCGLDFKVHRVFGPTSFMGVFLTNKMIDHVDLAADRFAAVRQVLEAWRFDRSPAGVPLDSRIWFALPQIRQLPGYPRAAASSEELLGRFSRQTLEPMVEQIIWDHPRVYARTVVESFCRFWVVDTGMRISLRDHTSLATVDGQCIVKSAGLQDALVKLTRPDDVVTRWLFRLFQIVVPIRVVAMPFSSERSATTTLIALLVLVAALSCAMVEYGNGRFAIPYQPLVGFVASMSLIDACKLLGAPGPRAFAGRGTSPEA